MPSFTAAQKLGVQPTVTPQYLETARAVDATGKQRISDSLLAEQIAQKDKDFATMWSSRKAGGDIAAKGLLNYYTYGDPNYGEQASSGDVQFQFGQEHALSNFDNPDEILAQLQASQPQTRVPGAFSIENHDKALKESPGKETLAQVGKQLYNTIPSAVNMVKGAYNMTGLPGASSNPIQVAKGLGQAVIGGIDILDKNTFGRIGLGSSNKTGVPYLDNAPQVAKAAFDELVTKRWGSIEAARKTMYEDPLGAITDILTVAGGMGAMKNVVTGGKAADGVSGVTAAQRAVADNADNLSMVSPAQRAERVFAETSGVTDGGATAAAAMGAPAQGALSFAGKAMKAPFIGAKKVGDAAGEVAKGVHGFKMGVGKGAIDETIRTARFGTAEGNVAMREGAAAATVNEAKALENVIDNLNKGREIMGDNYRSKLGSLKSPELDTNPIGEILKKQMGRFNLEMAQKKIGKGDLSKESTFGYNRSSIAPGSDAAQQIEKYMNEALNWGKDPRQTFDVIGLDTLRKRLSDVFPEDPKARAFVTPIQNEIVNTLNKVPGYKEMTSEYEHLSGILDDVRASLSTGGSRTTAIGKLTNILKNNHEFKAEALRALLELTGDTTTMPKLAGLSMGQWNARGAAGVISPMTSLSAYSLGGIAAAFGDLALSSPKIMREFYSALGFSQRITDKMIEFGRKKGLGKALSDEMVGAYGQVGRVNEAIQKKKQVEDLFPPKE